MSNKNGAVRLMNVGHGNVVVAKQIVAIVRTKPMWVSLCRPAATTAAFSSALIGLSSAAAENSPSPSLINR